VNLTKVAQSVGNPGKFNCGSCHFMSGGGNNVKHGDLEMAQLACDRNVDVHMAANGMDMSCVTCHTAENHQVKGRLYSVSSTNSNRATCEQCHTNTPHFDEMLNRHTAKVSCQACHIPTYAKVNPTKMSWKWSDAGELRDGEPYDEFNSDSTQEYLSIKGTFTWAKNVKPDYIWFNGTADHYLLGDTIKSIPVQMNTLFGSHDNKESKILWNRDGQTMESLITPGADSVIGVMLGEKYTGPVKETRYNIFSAIPKTFRDMYYFGGEVFVKSIAKIIKGDIPFKKAIGGPVKIAKASAQSAEGGFLTFINFVALLSMSLAIINILPFPALDGGHFIMLLLEAIFRKPIPYKVQITLQYAGFIILLAFMLFVIYNDIISL